MKPIIIIIHICVCAALIFIVLLQKGKGAGMGVAFGGSSQTVFGSSGATTFLQKLTTIVAIVFMVTSLSLSFFLRQGPSSSIMEGVSQQAVPETVPAAEKSEVPAQPQTGDTKEGQK